MTKLGAQGRLVMVDDGKRVDVSATLERLSRTSSPEKDAVRARHAEARSKKYTAADSGASDDAAGSNDPKYWDNKTRREGALAELAELELSKKRGDLVDRARVESAAFAIGRMLRDAVLGLPTRLAPDMATMTDAFEIETKLRAALRQVFEDAAKMSADDLEKALEPRH